jgi:hypothetical protein
MRIFEIQENSPQATLINIEASDIYNFLSEKCPIAVSSPINIYRGINTVHVNKLIYGDSRTIERVSANTENYYTLIIDNFLPEWNRYPKRSKSFICTSDLDDASCYGTVYQVYPLNNPLVGVCPTSDFWNAFENLNLGSFSYYFKSFASYCDMIPIDNIQTVSKIIDALNKNWHVLLKSEDFVEHICDNFSISFETLSKFTSFSQALSHALNPGKNFFGLYKLSVLPTLTDSHELWFSGPAYFVEEEY